MMAAAIDRIRISAQSHGWRFRDPGNVAWRSLYERYSRDNLMLAVRYTASGAILRAHLIRRGGECIADVQPRTANKLGAVTALLESGG